ncbi:hypothetical protein M8C21_023170, partial [Ambrosia artemisiifolia]
MMAAFVATHGSTKANRSPITNRSIVTTGEAPTKNTVNELKDASDIRFGENLNSLKRLPTEFLVLQIQKRVGNDIYKTIKCRLKCYEEAIILKSKEKGLDVIKTYVFWNLHESVNNQYSFKHGVIFMLADIGVELKRDLEHFKKGNHVEELKKFLNARDARDLIMTREVETAIPFCN